MVKKLLLILNELIFKIIGLLLINGDLNKYFFSYYHVGLLIIEINIINT